MQSPTKVAFDESETRKRYAMVIDLKKCLAKEDCKICIDACHKTHNVPDFGNKKDEIKWIWKEEYEHAFPNQENYYLKEELKHSRFRCSAIIAIIHPVLKFAQHKQRGNVKMMV